MNINDIDIIWQQAPSSSLSPGAEGWMAKDNNFIYIYTNGKWKREPISIWQP